MASLGHIAVGMAAARIYGTPQPAPRQWIASAAAWSALSMLPDADVIGFAFGIEYEDAWGHRGATHSIAFSLALGLVIGFAAAICHRPPVRTALIASAVLVSHAVLDMLTNGGLGCAFFWPFDLTRYFAPWNPIPVSPIGLYYFSAYGLTVALTEMVLFAPVWVFALWPHLLHRQAPVAIFSAVWLGVLWLLLSGSPRRDAIIGGVLRDDTEYASRYSEEKFRTIRLGHSPSDVRERVGAPFGESWFYVDRPDTCPGVHFQDDVVVAPSWPVCEQIGIRPGMSRVSVEQLLGPPLDVCWRYSRSASRPFRLRMVCFADGRVGGVVRSWVFGS